MPNEQKMTRNTKVPNNDLEVLRAHFPHCFDKDGKFQLEKFQKNLADKDIHFSTESYGLEWLGKSYARLLACDPATTLLKPDESHNARPENARSQNLLLKGDNLEVLKHLAHAYHEKVKMIYIDPPYNTGSDGFIYHDNRKFTAQQLQELIGADAQKAKRILDFTQQKSNSHSAWLTFLYPRLYIAKQLLQDDGVIFVSIDDNEVAQLRLLMDEIFGEENFVANLIWKRRVSTAMSDDNISSDHEYVLTYSKSNNFVFSGYGKDFQKYSNPDNDPRGPWIADNLTVGMNSSMRPNQAYDLIDPKTGIKFPYNPNRVWAFIQSSMERMISEGRIIFPDDPSKRPMQKRFQSELKSSNNPFSTILIDKVGLNTEATRELQSLFEINVFDYSKPKSLIRELLNQIFDKTSIILDFFAGSGTTGDAVMQLNAEDGGRRRYMLVQLPEAIDPGKNKAAHDFVKNELGAEPTIFEITRERLVRAAAKTRRELIAPRIAEMEKQLKNLEGQLGLEGREAEIERLRAETAALAGQDLGFRIFETAPIWDDYDFEADWLDPSQTLFDEEKLTADDVKALLTTWKTYDGIPLTQDLEEVPLGSYNAFYGKNKLYLMDKGFGSVHLIALLQKIDDDRQFNPGTIIAFGYHFESKMLLELSENLKTYSNRKNIDVDFITRY
jgi:adenine-specific DNA-methyltransferase